MLSHGLWITLTLLGSASCGFVGYGFGVLGGRLLGRTVAKLIYSDEALHTVGVIAIGYRVECFADLCGAIGLLVGGSVPIWFASKY